MAVRAARSRFLISCASMLFGGVTFAETHPPAPALSSRPGAAYTLYLDFSGFNFSGKWAVTPANPAGQGTPGNRPAYDTDGDATTFTNAEISKIKECWARTAEKYSPFNVNVTTVDPAVAA